MSDIRAATEQEIEEARKAHAEGKCWCRSDVRVVVDEYSYMYDFRSCFICGRGLGTV